MLVVTSVVTTLLLCLILQPHGTTCYSLLIITASTYSSKEYIILKGQNLNFVSKSRDEAVINCQHSVTT